MKNLGEFLQIPLDFQKENGDSPRVWVGQTSPSPATGSISGAESAIAALHLMLADLQSFYDQRTSKAGARCRFPVGACGFAQCFA